MRRRIRLPNAFFPPRERSGAGRDSGTPEFPNTPNVRAPNPEFGEFRNAHLYPPEEEKWEYIRVLHVHYKFHRSLNLLTNHKLQHALAQHDPQVVTAAVAGSSDSSVNWRGGELSEALGQDGWLFDHLAKSHGWFSGHKYNDLFNCAYNNHFWKGSVTHLAGLKAYKSGQPGPGKRSQAHWDKVTGLLEASRPAGGNAPAGLTQPRVALLRRNEYEAFSQASATTLDTPASVILSPSYAGQHLNQYSVIAAIGLANRIRVFYRELQAARASNRPLPELLIVITSLKLLLILLTTLAVAVDRLRAQTGFDEAVDAERGWIGLATRCDKNPAFSDLRRLNDTHLDQVYTVSSAALCPLATAVLTTLTKTPSTAQLVAHGAPPAKADRLRLMALAIPGRSAAQIANTLRGSGR